MVLLLFRLVYHLHPHSECRVKSVLSEAVMRDVLTSNAYRCIRSSTGHLFDLGLDKGIYEAKLDIDIHVYNCI